MLFAALIFFFSLVCITCLFGLKYWELRNERVLFSDIRGRFDMRAHHLKELMIAARLDISKLPPEMLRLGRFLLHRGALAFAEIARMSERQAHRLADLVSYKHRFEKRETRSEFLKKVAEHKNGRGENEVDTTE